MLATVNPTALVSFALAAAITSGLALADEPSIRVERELHGGKNPHYISNREPLAPSPLVKLPIGSIIPRGWLRSTLELEAKGLTGRLMEVSPWCKFEGNSWTDPEGKGHSGWEEMPYWLKGYGDLGYVLHDDAIIRQARKWIEAILASQASDGWFGPRGLKTSLEGKPDLWPHMLALNILQSFYEATGDDRVLPFMTKYFRWELNCPSQDFLTGYWPKLRAGDNLESVYWLYNRTGEPWLLDLAKKIHEHTADWTTGVPDWHGVNLSQGFREPGVYFVLAKDEKFLRAAERNYDTVIDRYGQFPGGGFGADEVCRPGYDDPRQGFETCSIVELMHSFQMLSKISGNPLWADRCEELAFNLLPASQTPDLKALHYLTSANMIQLDRHNKSPGIQNGGTMFSFSPLEVYRCCQHNVSHGWPYYAEELWLATADGGLCASLYAASEVSAVVGNSATDNATFKANDKARVKAIIKPNVKITEETDYPFEEKVNFKIAADRAVKFPLRLRVPRWCKSPALEINGQAVPLAAEPLSYVAIDRVWKDGDRITFRVPMATSVRTWEKNHNSVSVDYGPLTFSLEIGEKWVRYGGTDEWPEQEVFPATAWNYALVLDEKNPAASFEVVRTGGPLASQPFTLDAAPIRMRAQGKRVAAWKADELNLVGKLQASPVRTDAPTEALTLVPMGCARLRITSFPVAGGAGAHEWTPPPTASHLNPGDTLDALTDGREPANSNDRKIPRFTWWDHRGTTEWVQLNFGEPRRIAGAAVYWFDDTESGECRVPDSWRLLIKDGEEWVPVLSASAYGVEKDKYNTVTFDPVSVSEVRLEAKLQPNFSAGILEWKVK